MQTEENKAIVRRFVETYQSTGNEAVALEIMAENFVDHSAIPPFTPDRDGVIQLFRMMRGAFSDFRGEIHDQVAEGDKVTTRKTSYGTHTGEFFGVPPTNRPIQIGVIDILRLENGKFTDHWCQVDFAGLMSQITK
jgi:predicted ester cyclase